MTNTFYRFAPLSTTALRTLVGTFEGLVILQFWLTSRMARAAAARFCSEAFLHVRLATPALRSVQLIWLVMTVVIAAAFGLLLGLRLLVPVAPTAETTDVDLARLAADFAPQSESTMSQEP